MAKVTNEVVATEQSQLIFVSTISLADFKDQQGVSTVDIIKNPNTDKLFFSTGSSTGAVSTKLDTDKVINVSLVRTEDGVEFYLMHNKADENIVATV